MDNFRQATQAMIDPWSNRLPPPKKTAPLPPTPSFAQQKKGFGEKQALQWVSQNATRSGVRGASTQAIATPPSQWVSISIDPNQGNRIIVNAPQAFLDSPEYKEQLLPHLKSLEGRPLDDIQASTIFSKESQSGLSQLYEVIRERNKQLATVRKTLGEDATERDLNIVQWNSAAAEESDNNTKSLVTTIGSDGEETQRTVKSLMEDFNSMSAPERGMLYRGYQSIIDNKDTDVRNRAIAMGMQQFMLGKRLIDADAATKFTAGGDAFIAATDKGGVGWVANQPTRIANAITGQGWVTNAQMARQRLENDPTYNTLQGLGTATTIGGLLGTGATLAADIIPSVATGGLGLTTGLTRLAATGGRTGRALTSVGNSLAKLEKGGGAGRLLARTIRTVPEEVAFSGLQTAANWGEYDGVRETLYGIGFNAATMGIPRGAMRALSAIDPDASTKLARYNAKVASAINTGLDTLTDLPGIKQVSGAIHRNAIDGTREGRKIARKNFRDNAKKLGATEARDIYKLELQNIALYRDKGAPLVRVHSQSSIPSQNFEKAMIDYNLSNPEKYKELSDYINAVQEKQYITAGVRDKPSKATMEKLDGIISKGDANAEFVRIRGLAAEASEELSTSPIFRDATDAQLMSELQESAAFRDGYVALSKSMNPEIKFNFESSSKWKDRGAQRRLKKEAAAEYVDPLLAFQQKRAALAELQARAEMGRMVRQAVDSGYISGRVIQEPKTVRAVGRLNHILNKVEKEAVEEITTTMGKELAEDATRLVDDIEDLYGPGAKRLDALMDNAVDDAGDLIAKNSAFDEARSYIRDNMPDGRVYDEHLANLEILSHYRKDFVNSFGSAAEKVKGPYKLNDDEVGMLKNLFADNLDDKAQVARAANEGRTIEATDDFGRTFRRSPESRDEIISGGDLPEPTVNLRERNEELKRLRRELDPVSGNEKAVPIWDEGARGYIEIDDPVVRNFLQNQTKNAANMGLFNRIMMNTSRIFREMTTGLNPVFGTLVNPARDIPFSAITAGTDVFRASRYMDEAMDLAGIPRARKQEIIARMEAYGGGSTRVEAGRLSGDYLSQTRRDVRAREADGLRDKTLNVFKEIRDSRGGSTLRLIEDINPSNLTERYVRNQAAMTAYAKAKMRGVSDGLAEAAGSQAYRDAVTDFLNVGSSISDFTRTVPYLTAAINGQASFLRMWQLDPIGVTSRLVAGATMPIMAITMHNLRDPEMAAAYFDIPEWERRNNLIIMMPGGDNFKIPLPHEILPIVNPFVDSVEALHGTDRGVFDIVKEAFLSAARPENVADAVTPFDLSGFGDRDIEGNVDGWRAITRAAGGVLPQALRSPVELISGRDLYTGQSLEPTDAEIRRQLGLEPDEEITDSMRSRAGGRSRTLGNLSSITGIPQFALQNILKNYGGTVGQFVLNGVDKMAGAPPEEQGGRGILDNIARRFFGKSYSQSQQDFYNKVNEFEERKGQVRQQLDEFNSMAYQEPGREAEIAARSQALVDQYADDVGEFASLYGDFYQQAGGIKPFQINTLINLLNFAPTGSGAPNGSWQGGIDNEARMAAWNQANEQAQRIGLPDSNERDRYGRLIYDELGDLVEDWSRTSRSTGLISQRYYDAPKQAAYEFDQALKASSSRGVRSLNDLRQPYWDRIRELRDEASGLKGSAAQAVYDEIHRLQEEYMTEVFDPRIRPLIEKWGPGALTSKAVTDALSGQIMIPGDFTPFFSKKRTPYLKEDVKAYIRDRYGVGDINRTNLPTGKEAEAIIERINNDLSQGRVAAANAKLNDLQEDVDSGTVYVNMNIMNDIRQKLNNSRRR